MNHLTLIALCHLSQLIMAHPAFGYKRANWRGLGHSITGTTAHVANETFDYIVCGGGLTGLSVASRLTEDPDIHVLVIEAGFENQDDPLVNDVRNYGQAFGGELDHSIYSTPVEWQNGKQLLLVAGKTLGGSGSLNGASWTKGARSQYDLLPLLTGDDAWGWTAFNKHMLKAENFNPPTQAQMEDKGAHYNYRDHGSNGPVHVSFGSGMFGGTQLLALEAAENMWPGFTRNYDAASGRTTGGTIIPNMVEPGEHQNRSSPFTAYALHQVVERPNFTILTGHRVTEIIWSSSSSESAGLVAEGVHFQSSPNAPVEIARATREVLLAAGSLQSPQILELSGVGDPEVLSQAGVNVRLPLKGVGKNMQEQTKNTVTYQAKDGIDFDGTGPPSAIAFPTALQLLGDDTNAWYERTKAELAKHAAKLEEKGIVANGKAMHTILQAQLDNLFNETDAAAAEAFFTIDPATNTLGIDNWNLIVLSRGFAHIRSTSPWDHPVVEPNYFDHPLDLAFQLAINKQSRRIFQTAPLSDHVTAELVPGHEAVPSDADDTEWEAWVKKSFTSVWHYISTLAMMKEEYGGVVDSRLRVYGIRNVRAIDASVLPVQLSAHLSSSLYGIAEKAAEMIKADQGDVVRMEQKK